MPKMIVLRRVGRETYKVSAPTKGDPRFQTVSLARDAGFSPKDLVVQLFAETTGTVRLRRGDLVLRKVLAKAGE